MDGSMINSTSSPLLAWKVAGTQTLAVHKSFNTYSYIMCTTYRFIITIKSAENYDEWIKGTKCKLGAVSRIKTATTPTSSLFFLQYKLYRLNSIIASKYLACLYCG